MATVVTLQVWRRPAKSCDLPPLWIDKRLGTVAAPAEIRPLRAMPA
jgi:hypothetical protein